MLSETQFIAKLKSINKPFPSKTGTASYSIVNCDNQTLRFLRINTQKEWTLDIPQLYKVYKSNNYIDTAVVKRNTGGRVNSPSVAVLMEIKSLDQNGNRID